MNKTLNILIVEDEAIIAHGIKEEVEKLGHAVTGICKNALDALDALNKGNVELALLDITLKGEKNGIWLGGFIKSQFDIPFIYLTSHYDQHTIDEAIQTKPSGYIVKPFTRADITTSLQIAYNQHEARLNSKEQNTKNILLKEGDRYVKISFSDFQYLRSERNYLHVYHSSGVTKIRSSIKEFMEQNSGLDLVQIHRSFLVNILAVTGYDSYDVFVNSERLPLGSSYKDQFTNQFKRTNNVG